MLVASLPRDLIITAVLALSGQDGSPRPAVGCVTKPVAPGPAAGSHR